jgi:seryl-tRNA synthetase
MLDLNLFQSDKGGDPGLIRESQRRRGAPIEFVDKVIDMYDNWRKGYCSFIINSYHFYRI